MASIKSFLGGDHDRCDELFFKAESGAGNGKWDIAADAFHQFKNALEHHLKIEEEILFPAMEGVMGGGFGPTGVMRHEHQQMRQIVQDLSAAVEQRDAEEFLGNCETLNILMQQHNFKEENMLYAMADRALESRCDEIIAAMAEIKEVA